MNNFYKSREWREIRYVALRASNRSCQCCGAKNTELHVDHIKPISKYPHLKLDLKNLQILCRECNLGKSNIFEDDFSKPIKLSRKLYLESKKLRSTDVKPKTTKGFVRFRNLKISHFWDGQNTACKILPEGKFKKIKPSRIKSEPFELTEVCKNCLKSGRM